MKISLKQKETIAVKLQLILKVWFSRKKKS